eukprot:15469010-Alexandrium_andersonii.AAC.1
MESDIRSARGIRPERPAGCPLAVRLIVEAARGFAGQTSSYSAKWKSSASLVAWAMGAKTARQ